MDNTEKSHNITFDRLFTDPQFVTSLWRYKKEEVEEALCACGLPFLDMGAECLVLEYPEQPELVIALTRHPMGIDRAHLLFYMHNALALLFPHNFPKFFRVFSTAEDSTQKRTAGTVRERIRFSEEFNESDIAHPFIDVWNVIRSLHIPIGIDDAYGNRRVALDKSEYYIDLVEHVSIAFPREWNRWSKEEIITYMEQHSEQYTAKDIRRVRRYISAINYYLDRIEHKRNF